MDQNTARGLSWPLVVLALLAVVTTVVLARTFLMPVFLALLVSITVSPIRRTLAKHGVGEVVTAALVVGGLLAAVVAIVYALSGPVQEYASNGEQIANEVERKLRGVNQAIEAVAEATDQVEEMTATTNANGDVATVVVKGPSIFARVAVGAPFMLGQVLFTLVLLFFLVASGDLLYRRIVEVSPTFQDKRRSIQIARDIEKRLSRYFLTITIINACLGAAVGFALWAIGMPNPLLFAVGAFALNFIPYIGAIAGVALTFALGLVSFDTVGQAGLGAGIYLALTALEGQLITPYAVGRSLELNPVVVFISVAFWGWAWSYIGMFIAVPTLITFRVLCENVPALVPLGGFLASDSMRPGDPEPDVSR